MIAWLLTWVWQGSALAACVAVALRFATRQNGRTRHAIWWAALAALAWLGWVSLPYDTPAPASGPYIDALYIPSAPSLVVLALGGIWAAMTLVRLLRVVAGVRAVFGVRASCRPFPAPLALQMPLWGDASRRGRRTRLMICDAVPGATVLGLFRPFIAIPAALIDALSIDELDQVILHEHAHVQRRDDWSRLVQTLLLSALWVHPAALFVSRMVSREREMACDEWVVARTGLPKAYARCLAHAAELRTTVGGSTLLPALIGRRHELVRRVERVLSTRNDGSRGVSFAGAAAAWCVMVMLSAPLQVVRFAEIADIIFPIAQVRQVQGVRGVRELDVPMFPSTPSPIARAASGAPLETVAHTAPDAPVAPLAPVALLAPIAPSLTARAFAGVYASAEASVTPAADASNRWKVMAAPARKIASAATKTGMRAASGFSRAGVSLAQRF